MNLPKQYHFRPGPQGLRAWDVHRLIALAESLPIEEVLLCRRGGSCMTRPDHVGKRPDELPY